MMRTSATGSEGFTLVVVMVVVVIIGLAAALTVLALPDSRPSLAQEGERFAVALAQVRDQAVLTNRTNTVRVDAGGYSVAGAPRVDWSEGDAVTIVTADGAPTSAASLSFDPTGVAGPAMVTLRRRDRQASVRLDQSGQVSVDATR